jgi:type I restriction enzyme S subunit
VRRSWKNASLGELCSVRAGGTPSRSKLEYWDGETPWVKISDMLQGTITATEERITRLGLENSAAKLLPVGTLLLSIFATIGRTAVLGIEAATNQAIVGLSVRDRSRLDLIFLRRFLELKTAELEGRARGVAQANINGAILKSLQIPLPPLAEQRRIAKVLDRAEALRAKRRTALAQLDSFPHSLFLDLFGDPDTNPKNWSSETVAELCARRANACVGGPFGSDLTQADYVEFPGVPVIRGQNLSTNAPFMDEEGFVFVSEAKAEALSRNGALRGDILVSQRGARLAGQVALIPSTSRFKKYIVSQSQMRISPDLNKVDPLYLVYYFRSPRAVRRMEARTISTGVPHINLGILREFLVELPPISLQREFARRVTAVEALKTMHRASLAELDALFATLQHRAFRGEL